MMEYLTILAVAMVEASLGITITRSFFIDKVDYWKNRAKVFEADFDAIKKERDRFQDLYLILHGLQAEWRAIAMRDAETIEILNEKIKAYGQKNGGEN
jgi:hypothetical protein